MVNDGNANAMLVLLTNSGDNYLLGSKQVYEAFHESTDIKSANRRSILSAVEHTLMTVGVPRSGWRVLRRSKGRLARDDFHYLFLTFSTSLEPSTIFHVSRMGTSPDRLVILKKKRIYLRLTLR